MGAQITVVDTDHLPSFLWSTDGVKLDQLVHTYNMSHATTHQIQPTHISNAPL